jgi:hypothetical protein
MKNSVFIKKPMNPYYLILWYFGFLCLVATLCIHATSDQIIVVYKYLQNLGGETILLGINRPYRIHQFLYERLDGERWQRIMIYFSFLLFSLLIFCTLIAVLLPRYLKYLSQTVSVWGEPYNDNIRKGVRYAYIFGFFLYITMVGMFWYGYSDLTVTPIYASAIQLNDFGFYQVALDAAIFCFSILIIQTAFIRKQQALKISQSGKHFEEKRIAGIISSESTKEII